MFSLFYPRPLIQLFLFEKRRENPEHYFPYSYYSLPSPLSPLLSSPSPVSSIFRSLFFFFNDFHLFKSVRVSLSFSLHIPSPLLLPPFFIISFLLNFPSFHFFQRYSSSCFPFAVTKEAGYWLLTILLSFQRAFAKLFHDWRSSMKHF